ncbi:MAG: UvrD-helicase domain-containing protein [Bryobacterales bacterium]|nr:UvrD-helicase domain-containing protein [Bryobacterales bacterium]
MSGAAIPRIGDAEARDRIRFGLEKSLIVEASAGTGKTTELIHRIVNTLRAGKAQIPGVAAVTFTNKAAGEMKLRLRQELDKARQQAEGEEARFLEDALERLEEAAIGTIHSFCAQILRERPVEACVDPAFRELDEGSAWRIYQRVFRGWIQQKLNEDSPGLRRALCRLAWRPKQQEDESPMRQLHFAGWQLIEWRDFSAKWERVAFRREEEVDRMVSLMQDAAHRMNKGVRPVHEFANAIERAERVRDRDYDTVEALLLRALKELNDKKSRGTEDLVAHLENFRKQADADLAAELRGELWDLVDRYEHAKRQSGMLDFQDLLMMTRDLVRSNAEVRAYLQQRFTHLFVDEFQDTDPLQAEILLLLAADDPNATDWTKARPKDGKLFVVGDPKQSIYKFRRADVVLYQSLKERLAAQGVDVVYLTRSYRSVRPIQHMVNAAFEPLMRGDTESGQAMYAPLEEHALATLGQPAVIALPAPRPYGKMRVSKPAIDACLPEAIVAFTDWLIRDSGWRVRDPEKPDQFSPISARHICLLFRRMINYGKDIAREYARHFESRGIPHLLVGSKSFHTREEVEIMRMALTAVEWPEDELAVFATLKGGLFAIPDALLLRYRHEAGPLHPFRKRAAQAEPAFARIVEALDLLAQLHRQRNRRPVADTVNLLLEATRAHAGFALRPAGQQVLANVYRVGGLAREFEASGGISFRGFIDQLEEEAQRTETQEAPVLEEGSDGVRLMTVHKAKGLEFPVVILADMTANLSRRDPERYVDGERGLCAMQLLWCTPWELLARQDVERRREEAEGVRVAYVAATRARDLLVVPAVGDEERTGWLEPLNSAIYPAEDRNRLSQPAPGCPEFGEASVLDRPWDTFDEPSVRPGLHQPQKGEHDVVWWDPALLKLGEGIDSDNREMEILAEGSRESHTAYEAWRAERAQAVERGATPEFDVLRATEMKSAPEEDYAVSWELAERPTGRPSGRRFGTLVHATLSHVPLEADQPRIREVAVLHGRLLGSAEAEVESAVETVANALSHPLLARARAAAQCHRELPVLLNTGQQIVEGVVDLAFVENGEWQIVDFKTDEDLTGRRSHYETQVKWYAAALSRLTGMPARASLLAL